MRKLKNDVVLHKTEQGKQSHYVLQDGSNYYELSHETYIILSMMKQGAEEKEIMDKLNEQNTAIGEAELNALIDYMDSQKLFEGQKKQETRGLTDMWGKRTVLSSEKIGRLPSCPFIFCKGVIITIVLYLTLWLSKVLNSGYFFKAVGYLRDFGPAQFLYVFVIIIGTSLIHETGHVMALKHCGYSAGEFGVGFYIVFPSFYVDVSQANLLTNRQRALVDIGGIYFQMTAIIILTALNHWVQSESIAFACYLSALMAIANLLPFTKSDGYFLLCDLLESTDPFHDAIKLLKEKKPIRLWTKNQTAIMIFSLFYSLCMGVLAIGCFLKLPVSFRYIQKLIRVLQSNPLERPDMSLSSILAFVVNVLPSFIIILFGKNIIMYFIKKHHSEEGSN